MSKTHFLLSNKKHVIENQNQLTQSPSEWAIVSGQPESKDWCDFPGIFAHSQFCEWARLKARTDEAFAEFLPTHKPIFFVFFLPRKKRFLFLFLRLNESKKVSGEWAKFTAKQELTSLLRVPTHMFCEWAEWANDKK